MSERDQFILFSRYNQRMNQRQYQAASALSEHDLLLDRGAFFKSVMGTLNHIMVGDIIWLKRFSSHSASRDALAYVCGLDKPKSLDAMLFVDFEALMKARGEIDEVIIHWIDKLTDVDLTESITYRNMAGESFRKPYADLISHLFLHQVHHRGQVTTLLSQCNVDFGETDLIEMIAEYSDTDIKY